MTVSVYTMLYKKWRQWERRRQPREQQQTKTSMHSPIHNKSIIIKYSYIRVSGATRIKGVKGAHGEHTCKVFID